GAERRRSYFGVLRANQRARRPHFKTDWSMSRPAARLRGVGRLHSVHAPSRQEPSMSDTGEGRIQRNLLAALGRLSIAGALASGASTLVSQGADASGFNDTTASPDCFACVLLRQLCRASFNVAIRILSPRYRLAINDRKAEQSAKLFPSKSWRLT